MSLKIYNTKITPDKNALIEDIESYLNANATVMREIADFQYQKIEANISIKIDIPQMTLSQNMIGNYARISQDGKLYYYFIVGARWLSQNTVELALAIDSLNTFPELMDQMTEATTVVREHRPRFRNMAKLQRDSIDRLQLMIDTVPEGVSNLPKIHVNSGSFEDTLRYDANWHLVYMSPNTPTETTPIECYLMPDRADIPYAGGTGGNVEKWCNPTQFGGRNDFPAAPYYFGRDTNPYGEFFFQSGYNKTTTITLGAQYEQLGLVEGVVFDTYKGEYDQPTSLKITVIAKSGDNTRISEITDGMISVGKITFTLATNWIKSNGDVEPLNAGATVNYLDSYSSLDLTDAKILKTIDCPYCPIKLTWTGNSLNRPAGIIIRNNRLLVSPFIEFERTKLNEKLIDLLQDQKYVFADMEHSERYIEDPKLLHSDFTTYSINYDSFGNEIRLEDIIWSTQNTPSLTIDYKQSSKMASDLGFMWDLKDGFYDSAVPYEHYLMSTRSNEDILFTNAYLEYIDYGQNFYKKHRAAESTARWVGASASIAGAALALGKGYAAAAAAKAGTAAAASMSGPLGVIAGLSMAATAIATFANAITSEVDATVSENEKLANLALQGTQIEGASDLALFKWYSGNKLKYNVLRLRDNLKEKFDDLFYYCGYATNIQKKPDYNTRYWFNFLQCDPDFRRDDLNDPNLMKWTADFANRLSSGITIYHKHNNEWDFEQSYENWEVELV